MAWYNEFDPKAAAWLQSLADGLTLDQLQTFDPKTYQIPVNATSLQESEGGDLRSDSQESQTMHTPGQQVSLANRSASAGQEKEPPMIDTCSQSSIGLCASSDLQSSLENRLRQRMDLNGSPEYTLQWRQKAISSGLVVCQLLASARHTKGSESSGVQSYPAPVSSDAEQGGVIGKNDQFRVTANGSIRKVNQNGKDGSLGLGLVRTALLMGYSTLSASDAQGSHGGGQGASARTDAQMLTHGATTSSGGQTAPRGALNPDFCRWLMGFPREWVLYGALAMQSFRQSRQSSSPRSSEQSKTQKGAGK